jgi:hypothetical protein
MNNFFKILLLLACCFAFYLWATGGNSRAAADHIGRTFTNAIVRDSAHSMFRHFVH